MFFIQAQFKNGGNVARISQSLSDGLSALAEKQSDKSGRVVRVIGVKMKGSEGYSCAD